MLGLFGQKSLNRGKVLIADDEENIRRVFRLILSGRFSQVEVLEACNGLEAVRVFQEQHPAIIIMDWKMPEMDGLDAALSVQQVCHEEGRSMPAVIFCTGFDPPQALLDMVGDGRYHRLITKPITSQEFVDKMSAALKFNS